MAEQKGGLGQAMDALRGGNASAETNKILGKIERNMRDDAFDVTKAVHKIDRKMENRLADLKAEQQAAFIRGEADSAHATNPFTDNEVTGLYVNTLKDIVSDVHHMTRDELANNIERMKALQDKIVNSNDVDEKEFLVTQYAKSMNFLEKEYAKRSDIMLRATNKIGELSEQYLDVQSLFSGFVDHNPVMMGLFKVGADALRSYRTRKATQAKMLSEDVRRRQFAEVIEMDRKKDQDLEAKRNEMIAKARMEAAEKGLDVDEDALQESMQDAISDAFGEGFEFPQDEFSGTGDAEMDVSDFFGGGGFEFPQDEYSDTGDAPLSAEDMQNIFSVTGGESEAIFSRDHDAEMEAERQAAMASMRRTAEDLEEVADNNAEVVKSQVENMNMLEQQLSTPPSPQPSVQDSVQNPVQDSVQDKVEEKALEKFEKIRGRNEDREDEEFRVETQLWQEEVLGKFDKVVGAIESQKKSFEKIEKAVNNSGDDSIVDDVVGTAVGALAGGAAGGGILAKFGSKLKKVPGLGKLAKVGGAVAGATGLGKVTSMFTKGGAMAGDTAEAIAKGSGTVAREGADDVAKAAGKAGGKAATKSAGKTAAKAILKKIPIIGLIAGGGFALQRMMNGDMEGAALELASGAASMLPGLGTATSVAIDAGLAARDMGAFDSPANQLQYPVAQSPGGPIFDKNYKGNIYVDKDGKPWTFDSKTPPAGLGTLSGDKPTLASASPTRDPVEMMYRNMGLNKTVPPRNSEGTLGVSVSTKNLLNEITEGEGTSDAMARSRGFDSGYDVPFGYGQYGSPDKALSEMTIAEVRKFQKEQIRATKGKIAGTNLGTGAVGKYQITHGTLKGLQDELGVSDDAKFTPELQDKMAEILLDRRGLDKFKRGEINERQFQDQLAKEWASVARSDTGMSHYGQPTGTSTDELQEALRGVKLEHSDQRQSLLQVAELEKGIGEYVLAKNQNPVPEVRTVAPPTKSHGIARQGTGGEVLREQPIGVSARNNESTLQRITDRWISQGFA